MKNVMIARCSAARGIQFLIAGALASRCGSYTPVARAAELSPAVKGLQLWVRADDLKASYQDGGRVEKWSDQSGHKNHLTSGSDDGRPTFKADGGFSTNGGTPHASVAFDGDARANPKINQWLNLPLTGEWREVTIFVIGKRMNTAGWIASASGGVGDLRSLGAMQITGTKDGIEAPFPPLAANMDAPGLATVSAALDDKGSLQFSTRVNGQAQKSVTDPDTVYSVLWSKAHLGNIGDGSVPFKGEISELLIYNRTLSDAERTATERYLMVKYGLAPSAGDTIGAPKIVMAGDKPTPTLPPVKTQPVKNGLQLWAKADDVKGVKEEDLVSRVPDASGQNHDLSAADNFRPRFAPTALNGRAALHFEGNPTTKVNQALDVPITGNWPEITMIFAGTALWHGGLFDTAPGGAGTLRHLGGAVQLTGATKGIEGPFQLLTNDATPQISAVTLSQNGDGGQTLTTFANGHLQKQTVVGDKMLPVLFRNAHIGNMNNGEQAWNGYLGEVMMYNRALSDTEIQQDTRYLSERYNILLKSDAQIQREQDARSHWTLTMTQLPRTMSWFGNSFSGKTTWVQGGISGGCVLPDGTVVARSVWDEGHREVGFYKDGQVIGKAIGGGGSGAVSDGKYLYVGISGMSKLFAGVRRLNLDGSEAPWPDMKPGEWPKFDTPDQWDEVRGLAVTGGELFVTAKGVDQVRVYDAATGAPKRAFAVTAPGALAADKDGKLWIGGPDGVAQYDAKGQPTGKKIADVTAGGLAFDNANRLLVADDKDRQQVIFYDISGAQPKEVKTLGERGGVFAGPKRGAMGDNRLMHPDGVGCDAAGNIYVISPKILRAYSPDGKLLWHLENTQFTTCSDVDPTTDGEDIYTGHEHYVHVAGQPPGKDWAWQGVTDDPLRFPELAEGGVQVLLRRLNNGQLYRFTPGESVVVHRLEPNSEIFVPVASVHYNELKTERTPLKAAPAKSRYIWTDRNGNGLVEPDEITTPPTDSAPSRMAYNVYVDSKGDIWEPQDRWGVRHIPLTGFTDKGAPIYDFAKEEWFKRPPEFIQVLRAVYNPQNDSMILSGFTWEHPAVGNEWWGQSGHEAICYDNWSKPTRKIRSRMPFPEGATDIRGFTVSNAANMMFAGEMQTAVIFAYDMTTGKLLGIVEPDKSLVGDIGWIDIDLGVRAFTRANEIMLLCEDSYMEKQLVYRVKR